MAYAVLKGNQLEIHAVKGFIPLEIFYLIGIASMLKYRIRYFDL